MARAHEIGIAADTQAFERGIRDGVIDPLDDAERALKQLGDAGEDAGREGARGLDKLDDALKDAQDASEKAERALKDVGDAGAKAGKTAADGVDRAGEGLDEFKNEAQSTATEAAASFDGSAESIGDAFQEVAANALSGFGPAGVVAGLALAAGIGIGMKAIEDATEAVEELQEIARDLAFDALEEGVDVTEFTRGTERVTEALKRLAEEGQKKFRFWWQEDQSALAEFNDDLAELGMTAQDAFEVMSLGDADLKKLRDSLYDTAVSTEYQSEASRAQADAIDRVIKTLDTEIETRSEAQEVSRALADAGVEDALRRQQAEQEAADAIAAATDSVQDSVSDAYKTMGADAVEFATTEDGVLDINRWLTYVQEHAQAVAEYQNNLQQLQLTPSEWSALMDMPEDRRVQWVDQLLAMPADTRQPFIDALDGMMGNAAAQGTVSFDENFNPDTGVTVTADTTQANAAADAFEQNVGSIPNKTVTANVEAHTGAAQRAIDDWFNRNNGRTVTTYTRNVGRPGLKNYP